MTHGTSFSNASGYVSDVQIFHLLFIRMCSPIIPPLSGLVCEHNDASFSEFRSLVLRRNMSYDHDGGYEGSSPTLPQPCRADRRARAVLLVS